MATLEQVKTIHQRAHDIVNGYIREIQDIFPTDVIYYTIPMLVNHWILLYHFIRESFQYHGDKPLISIDGNIATNISDVIASLHGSLVIPSQSFIKYIWKIKFIKYTDAGAVNIGIHAANLNYYNDYFVNENWSYAYDASGAGWDCDNVVSFASSGWKQGDTVSITYSGVTKSLSLSINDIYQKGSVIKVKDNDHGYKLGIYMGYEHDAVQLMEYIELNDDPTEIE